MSLTSLANVSKLCCILLLLIGFGSSIPFPQYENVELEEAEEEIDEPTEDDRQTEAAPAGVPEVETATTLFKVPQNYSLHKSPPLIDGQAIPVELGVLIFNVFDIREIQEEISLEVNYKLQWRDTRLLNWTKNIEPGQKYSVLNLGLVNKIWHPDIFIDYVKRVTQPMLISPAASLRIYKDGSVRYSSRTLIVLTCRMDFHFYPADTQECNVTIKSYAFADSQIAPSWKDGIGAQMAKTMQLPNFDITINTHPDFVQITKTNNYTALSFAVRLRRKLSYHIIQTYVPSTLFTFVSWLSFLVPPESTPGRMAICVTTLLTVTAMFGSVKLNTPNVSYIKALDIWMFMCIIFIFMALAEFTYVLQLRSRKYQKKTGNEPPGLFTRIKNFFLRICKCCKKAEAEENDTSAPAIAPPAEDPNKPTKYFERAQKIEKYVPRLVLLAFLCCMSIYWPYLLIRSKYFEMNLDPETMYSV